MDCPADAVLLELAEGRVAEASRDALEEHLDCCTMCREVVAEVGRAASPVDVSSDVAPSAVRALPSGARLGRYTLLHQLGAGGMGIVYAAHDQRLDRRVALKLLRRDLALRAPQVKARLLREAQAIARLAHPNVVTVFDAAVIDDDVVIAMELVTGGTLAALLRERRPGWRAVLDLFVQAGRGLAAAHAAGIVHRDFKPDNVLVTEGGRALVSDFGLAQLAANDTPSQPPEGGEVGLAMTRSGARVGTPAYMAPEQHAGIATDARTDQFSFCVALYEALYGARPFAGATREALAEAVSRGVVRPAPRGSRVPMRVRRALVRGLAVDASERHATMAALLAELTPKGRGQIAAAVAVVVAMATAAVVARAGAAKPPDPAVMCGVAGAPITGVWSDARSVTIAAQLDGLGLPYTAEAWPPARAALDAYARSWSAARVDACLATHARGEQSPHLLDLRERCLDRRLAALAGTVNLLERADRSVAPHLFEIVTSLQPVSSCSAQALVGPMEPPTDAMTVRLLDEAEADLGRARVLDAAGKLPEALAAARSAVATADRSGFAPLRAQALLDRALMEERNDQLKTAEATLDEAAWAAEACHADHVAAAARARLLWVIAFRQSRAAEAPRLARQAEVAIARAGGDDEARIVLLVALASVASLNDRIDEAIARYDEALLLVERVNGPDSQRAADLTAGLSDVYNTSGQLDQALMLTERALRLTEAHLGSGHFVVASMVAATSQVLGAMGRFEEALGFAERSLAIATAAFGPSHTHVGRALLSVAMLRRELGQCALAFPLLDRAATLLEPLTPDDWDRSFLVEVRAECLIDTGRSREALPLLEKTRAHLQASLPSRAGEPDLLIARALEGEGRFADACVVWKRAADDAHGETDPADHAVLLGGLGACVTKLGRAREGVALLENARASRAEIQGDPRQIGEIALDLARALRASGGDPVRVRALAEQARDIGRNAGIAGVRLARSAEVFLAR